MYLPKPLCLQSDCLLIAGRLAVTRGFVPWEMIPAGPPRASWAGERVTELSKERGLPRSYERIVQPHCHKVSGHIRVRRCARLAECSQNSTRIFLICNRAGRTGNETTINAETSGAGVMAYVTQQPVTRFEYGLADGRQFRNMTRPVVAVASAHTPWLTS